MELTEIRWHFYNQVTSSKGVSVRNLQVMRFRTETCHSSISNEVSNRESAYDGSCVNRKGRVFRFYVTSREMMNLLVTPQTQKLFSDSRKKKKKSCNLSY